MILNRLFENKTTNLGGIDMPYSNTGIQFNYNTAFERNIGWVTHEEQVCLGRITVAIPGLGGVGGLHALMLARLGVAKIRIADGDRFELPNLNRQIGATMATLGRMKSEVIRDQILEINPHAEVEIFPYLGLGNMADFVSGGVDIVVDGLDFFSFYPRRLLFQETELRNIPTLTAAPLGMGASLMCFWTRDGSLSFEKYFNFGDDEHDNLIRFLVGMSPSLPHAKYLVDRSSVDFANRSVPSTIMGCQVASALAESAVVKIVRGWLQNKRVIETSPLCIHQDAYLGKTWRTRRGPRNMLRLLALHYARKVLAKK